MSDEIRAAAERVTTFSDATPEDAMTVARAYLSEHPADEHEPVTEEWLEESGFVANDHGWRVKECGEIWLRVLGCNKFWDTVEAYHPPDDEGSGSSVLLLYDEDRINRGDVRRLLAALGITPEATK